jgi:arabinogalactan endo-1,4-beta-galactosidase
MMKNTKIILLPALFYCVNLQIAVSQSFFFGADLSYVNEMEDCGAVFKDNGVATDPFEIFAHHQCNLVRLRLWHTPSWYDALNAGKRYSDLADVRKSILRAKAAGMKVLLDFHLSDNWADPQKQRVPAAWEDVVDNLPLLKDSLYNYIFQTLTALHSDDLLPDMVQIGNETNKGILLSPEDDAAGWQLDWSRNSQLFNRAIEAVRAVETASGKSIEVALHCAGPADTGWLMEGFWNNGVTDFETIGMSYYWAWHKPTDIADAANVVAQLKQKYPGKKVMIFETGYIWTTQNHDAAGNIISEVHPAYSPASPDNQRKWLRDMTQAVINSGASGVIYWEPAWVSTNCWTQWGQGSHQEHATFFDFENNVLPNGGMFWMEHDYENLTGTTVTKWQSSFSATVDSSGRQLSLRFEGFQPPANFLVKVMDAKGNWVALRKFLPDNNLSVETLPLPELPSGVYFVVAYNNGRLAGGQKIWLN